MKKAKKILIIGPGSNQSAVDIYDNTWERWGINAAYRTISAPFRKMFNLHRLAHLERDCPQYVDWDSAYSRRHPKVQMVVVDSWKRLLTNQVLFPRTELEYQRRSWYHASSYDWLVAWATHLKASHIAVHGARFALDSPREEPISARACLEYWIGHAEGKGIHVIMGSDTDLFLQYHLVASRSLYGYDDVRMVERQR